MKDENNYENSEETRQEPYAQQESYAAYDTGNADTGKKKKKNRFAKTGLCLALICFLLGMLSFGIGAAFGGVKSIMAYDEWHPILAIGEFSLWSGAAMDKDMEFEEIIAGTHIEKMELEVNYGQVTIEQGAVMAVSAANVSESNYQCNYKNGVLTIKDKKKYNWLTGADTMLHQGKKITITIPEGVIIDELECSVGAGEMTADTLMCKDVSIDIGAGKGYIQTLIADEKLDLEVGAGEITVENMEAGKGEFECGAGHLKIYGDITGDIDVDCGVGEVNMTLSPTARDYSYYVDCGIGEVRIDGENYKTFRQSDHEHESEHGHGGCKVDVDCGIGSVNIDFY